LTIYKVVETKRPNAKDIDKDAGKDKKEILCIGSVYYPQHNKQLLIMVLQ
jgi:hypothetical protein